MNLNEILKMWEKDSVIDDSRLDRASVDGAVMHSKYLQLLSVGKLQLKKAERSQQSLLKDKWLYYNGKMSREELESKGWHPDPFNGLKILKGEMEYYYNADPEIQKSEELIEYWKTYNETLKEIIDNIKWRHQTIKNIIQWKQFEAGV